MNFNTLDRLSFLNQSIQILETIAGESSTNREVPQVETVEAQVSYNSFEIQKAEKEKVALDKKTVSIIQGLDFPSSFFSLKIKDALIMRVLKFMVDLQPLNITANGLFLSLIEELKKKPFDDINLINFRVFIRKLQQNLQDPKALDHKEHKKTKIFLEMLMQLEQIDPERVVSTFPFPKQLDAISNKETFEITTQFVGIILKVFEENLAFNSADMRKFLSICRKNPRASKTISLISKLNTLGELFLTRKLVITSQLEQTGVRLQKLTAETLPLVQYSFAQVETSAKLLASFNANLLEEIESLKELLSYFLKEQDIEELANSIENFQLFSERTEAEDELYEQRLKKEKESSSFNLSTESKKNLDSSQNSEETDMEEIQTLEFDTLKGIVELAKSAHKVSELMQDLAVRVTKINENKRKFRAEVQQILKDKTMKKSRAEQLQRNEEDAQAKIVYAFFCSKLSIFTICGKGIKCVQDLIATHKPIWVPTGLVAVPTPNLDELWPLYHDGMARRTVKAPPPQKEEDLKKNGIDTSKNVKMESPIQTSKDDIIRKLQSLEWHLDASVPEEERASREYYGKLSLRDSAHHLKVLFSNIERVKLCLKTENKDALAALYFSLVRSASIITEQNLTAEYTFRFGVRDLNHSQLRLFSILPENRNEKEQAELRNFLTQIDYMVFGHRCPHSDALKYQVKDQTPPETLKALLNLSSIRQEDLINLIISTIRFVEIRTASHFGTDHSLSKQIEKELGELLKSESIALVNQDKTLGNHLEPLVQDCSKVISSIKAKVKVLEGLPQRRIAQTHYKEALFHAKMIQTNLKFWPLASQTQFLASQGDCLWTHLQILDEQLETAYSFETQENPQRIHSLVAYRQFRGHQETRHHEVLSHLDQEIDSHYLHYGISTRCNLGLSIPDGLSWRATSVDLSMKAIIPSKGLVSSGDDSMKQQLFGKLLHTIRGELSMSLDLLNKK